MLNRKIIFYLTMTPTLPFSVSPRLRVPAVSVSPPSPCPRARVSVSRNLHQLLPKILTLKQAQKSARRILKPFHNILRILQLPFPQPFCELSSTFHEAVCVGGDYESLHHGTLHQNQRLHAWTYIK